MMGSRTYVCQTEGCERLAAWWVKRDHTKHVCTACRDELISVFDWVLLDW